MIYVPDGGASAAEAKDGDGKGDMSPSSGTGESENGGVSEGACLAELREKVAPGDFYLGAEFANFRRISRTCDRHSKNPVRVPGNSDLPVVWANPVKYLTSPERLVLLHAIEKKIPYPPERDRLLAKVRLFGPDQEALALRRFGDAAKEALARTAEVAEKCEFVFEDVVPNLPADLFPRALREVVKERLAAAKNLTWKERQRARRELAVVEQSGFGPYFLVVHDIVEFARRRGILHNLRGSGASSFLGWLLGVSHVNPIEFDLYFERFLNRGRPDPPDIDIDFDSRRRDEVLALRPRALRRGQDRRGLRLQLKDFGGRSALYETLRAFGVPPDEARGLSKRVPYFAEPSWLRRAAPAPGRLDVWKLAAELQDVYHEISLHVGGVILTPGPVERCLPLETSAKGLRMTHFDKDAVEDLRLIKLDLLSVRGLAAISETKEKLKLRTLPPGDAATYAALRDRPDGRLFPGREPGHDEPPAADEAGGHPRDHPGPGPGPAGADRERHEGGAPAAAERRGPAKAGTRPRRPATTPSWPASCPRPAASSSTRSRSCRSPSGWPACPRKRATSCGGACARGGAATRRFGRSSSARPASGATRRRTWSGCGRPWRSSPPTPSTRPTAPPTPTWPTRPSTSRSITRCRTSRPCSTPAAATTTFPSTSPRPRGTASASWARTPTAATPASRSRTDGDGGTRAIRVGLTSIKGLGLKTIERVLEERKAGGEYLSVEDFLARTKPGKAELLALIRAGVFDSLEPRRTRQVLRYFQGLEHMEEVADIASDEKRRMLYESLGFLPEGDELDLYEGKRPALRVKDLKDCAGTTGRARRPGRRRPAEGDLRHDAERERPRRARRRGRRGGEDGGARTRTTGDGGGGAKYFYLFEDETGLLEGIGETRCAAYGTPPVCFLRGEVRKDGEGVAKIISAPS